MLHKPTPIAVVASEVPVRTKPSVYPAPFASSMTGSELKITNQNSFRSHPRSNLNIETRTGHPAIATGRIIGSSLSNKSASRYYRSIL